MLLKFSMQPYSTCPIAFNNVGNGGRETNDFEMPKRWFVSLPPSPMKFHAMGLKGNWPGL
jgi:hypothetical protein